MFPLQSCGTTVRMSSGLCVAKTELSFPCVTGSSQAYRDESGCSQLQFLIIVCVLLCMFAALLVLLNWLVCTFLRWNYLPCLCIIRLKFLWVLSLKWSGFIVEGSNWFHFSVICSTDNQKELFYQWSILTPQLQLKESVPTCDHCFLSYCYALLTVFFVSFRQLWSAFMSAMLCFYLRFQRCPSDLRDIDNLYLQMFFLGSIVFLHFITNSNNTGLEIMSEILVVLKSHDCKACPHKFVELSESIWTCAPFDPQRQWQILWFSFEYSSVELVSCFLRGDLSERKQKLSFCSQCFSL